MSTEGNDNDDSQMLSSPASSTSTTSPQPQASTTAASRSPPQMPTSSSSSTTGANANGKRPINHISNGGENDQVQSTAISTPTSPSTASISAPFLQQGSSSIAAAAAAAAAAATKSQAHDFPSKTHDRSGYTWAREEDAPGYAWMNKKALDEYHRSWEQLAHRDLMIKGRYGDPFEIAKRERAMLNSLTQK